MARKKPLPQIKIRLPQKLRRDLERDAAKNGRTLNGEIVYRLSEPYAVIEATKQVTRDIRNELINMMASPHGPLTLRALSKPEGKDNG